MKLPEHFQLIGAVGLDEYRQCLADTRRDRLAVGMPACANVTESRSDLRRSRLCAGRMRVLG